MSTFLSIEQVDKLLDQIKKGPALFAIASGWLIVAGMLAITLDRPHRFSQGDFIAALSSGTVLIVAGVAANVWAWVCAQRMLNAARIAATQPIPNAPLNP